MISYTVYTDRSTSYTVYTGMVVLKISGVGIPSKRNSAEVVSVYCILWWWYRSMELFRGGVGEMVVDWWEKDFG